jgi:hypothetical protein
MTDFAIPGLMPVTAPLYDSKSAFYDLPSYDKANTLWPGIALLGPVYQDDGETPPVNAASAATLSFRGPTSPEDEAADLVLSSADGKVVISNEILWRFSVPAQALGLARGVWSWVFSVTSNGAEIVIAEGSLTIT